MKNNTNIKKLISGALVVSAMACCQYGYAKDYSDSDLVKIAPSFLEFNKPGDQVVTVTNNSEKDLMLDDIHFIGTQFTVLPILRSITTKGFDGCSNIPKGKSCTFIVTAADNASTTANPDGANTKFSVKYRFDQKKKTEYIANFEVKIDYNSDLEFKERNLMFINPWHSDYTAWYTGKENDGGKTTKKLEIRNSNPEHSVKITRISLLPEELSKDVLGDAVVEIGNYDSCANLKSGGSCQVDIIVDDESGDAAVPINIEYDVGDRKQVLTTAAAVIKRESPETSLGSCVASGTVAGGAITLSYANKGLAECTEELTSKALTKASEEIAGLTKILVGKLVSNLGVQSSLAGLGYSVAGNYKCEQKGNLYNRLAFVGSLSNVLSLLACGSNPLGWKLCSTAVFGCTFLGSASGDAMLDYIFPESLEYLPEGYKKSVFEYVARSLPGDFTVKAAIRETCKGITGVAGGDFGTAGNVMLGILGDTAASSVMAGISNGYECLYGSDDKLPMIGKGEDKINPGSCDSADCVCFDNVDEARSDICDSKLEF